MNQPPEGLGGEPWTRQARESDVQHLWFTYYRDSAYPDGLAGRFVARSLPQVAEDLGYPLATLRGVADSFAWAWRAAAFDRVIDERRQLAEMAQADREREQHGRALSEFHEIARLELAKLKRKAEGEADALRPSELIKLFETMVKLRRLLADQSTENVQIVDELDYEKLTEDELLAYKALRAKAKGE